MDFDTETMKAMDLIRAVKKGKVATETGADGKPIVTKDEFQRWALRIVDLHAAGGLEAESV